MTAPMNPRPPARISVYGGPEPVAGVWSLLRQSPGDVWRDAGAWPPEHSAAAYAAFFEATHETTAGGSLLLFNPRGSVACNCSVSVVITLDQKKRSRK